MGGRVLPRALTEQLRVYNPAHSITTKITNDEGTEGVIIAHGNRHGGYTLFVKDGHLNYAHNYLGKRVVRVRSPEPLASGPIEVRYEFEPTGDPDFDIGKGAAGRAQLYLNGSLIASEQFEYTVPNLFGIIGVSCGRDGTDSVSPGDYSSPFSYSGEISHVTIDLSGDVIVDEEAELNRLMTQQ